VFGGRITLYLQFSREFVSENLSTTPPLPAESENLRLISPTPPPQKKVQCVRCRSLVNVAASVFFPSTLGTSCGVVSRPAGDVEQFWYSYPLKGPSDAFFFPVGETVNFLNREFAKQRSINTQKARDECHRYVHTHMEESINTVGR